MVFSSSVFLFIYLPIVLIGYYLIRKELRNMWLLAASIFFYAWGEPQYIVVMIISIAINYISGLFVDFAQQKEKKNLKKFAMILSVLMNLGMLFYFKYFNFFISNVNSLLHTEINIANIMLPIGISFFTFQGMSYVIDLYRQNVPVQKNPFHIALYIAMFPQLIAGPIVRYIDVNEQISNRFCNMDKFILGIKRFIIGLAKKAILANILGQVADSIFTQNPLSNTAIIAWLGIICYTMQIYFDFSGYSDMAIGLGKMFGFDFLENFDHPYISQSITEFWRRWHISLSGWFRDYLYIPLGGNRRGNVYFNLFVVFFATGLWHGASWNFLVWGLFHGFFIIMERIFKNKQIKLPIPRVLRWAGTMLIIIIGWVLFRSENLTSALQYLGIMFGILKPVGVGYTFWWYYTSKCAVVLLIAVIACVPLHVVSTKNILRKSDNFYVNFAKYSWCGILLVLSMMQIMVSSYNPFIYFRF